MSPSRRREMVDREHPSLPIVGQCAPRFWRPLNNLEGRVLVVFSVRKSDCGTAFQGPSTLPSTELWVGRLRGAALGPSSRGATSQCGGPAQVVCHQLEPHLNGISRQAPIADSTVAIAAL